MLGSEHDDFDPTPLARLQDGSGCGRRRLAAIFAMTGLCAGGPSLKRLNKPKLPMWPTAEVGGCRVGFVHGDAQSLGRWHHENTRAEPKPALTSRSQAMRLNHRSDSAAPMMDRPAAISAKSPDSSVSFFSTCTRVLSCA